MTILMFVHLIYSQLDGIYDHNILNLFFALVSSMRNSTAPQQPRVVSSDSSETETTDRDNIFRPQTSRETRWSNKPITGSTEDPRAVMSRPGESPIRQGLDKELQTFINMRDKADKATEVGHRIFASS